MSPSEGPYTEHEAEVGRGLLDVARERTGPGAGIDRHLQDQEHDSIMETIDRHLGISPEDRVRLDASVAESVARARTRTESLLAHMGESNFDAAVVKLLGDWVEGDARKARASYQAARMAAGTAEVYREALAAIAADDDQSDSTTNRDDQ